VLKLAALLTLGFVLSSTMAADAIHFRGPEAVVPQGKNYAMFVHGKVIKIKAGTKVSTVGGLGVVNCFKIDCPAGFDPSWVCWRCKETAEAKGA
jgi:hypothetical protein